MDYRETFKRLREGALAPVYVLCGEESYLRNQAYQVLKKRILDGAEEALNHTILNGKSFDARAALDAVRALPFMAEYRLLEIRDHPAFSGKKGRKTSSEDAEEPAEDTGDATGNELITLIKQIPSSTVVLFHVKGNVSVPPRSRLMKAITEAGGVMAELTPLSRAEALPVIARFAAENGVTIQRADAEFLFDYCGADLTHLQNETAKAAAISQGRITQKEIREICTQTVEFRIFELTGHIFSGNKTAALELLENLLRSGEVPGVILSLLEKQLRRIYLVHACGKADSKELAKALGENSDYPFVLAARQSRKMSREKAEELILRCGALDVQIKQGQIDGEAAARLMVMSCLSA